jgi:hypothetical protein
VPRRRFSLARSALVGLAGFGALVVIVACVLGVAGFVSPDARRAGRSLWAVANFKLNPGQARTEHLVRLRGVDGQIVVLVGTTHHHLFSNEDFSIWHLKAVFLGLDVDTVLLEVLPGAAPGDGPVEMPFLRALAGQRGTPVCAIDAPWEGGWRVRQARMFERALGCLRASSSPTPRTAFVVTGYLHTRPFVEQFRGAGYVVEPWSDEEKQALLARPVPRVLPPGYRAALEASLAVGVARAAAAGGDEPWDVTVRRRILERVGDVPDDR